MKQRFIGAPCPAASGSVDSRTLRDRLLASLLLQHGAKPDIQDCDLDSPLLVGRLTATTVKHSKALLLELLHNEIVKSQAPPTIIIFRYKDNSNCATETHF